MTTKRTVEPLAAIVLLALAGVALGAPAASEAHRSPGVPADLVGQDEHAEAIARDPVADPRARIHAVTSRRLDGDVGRALRRELAVEVDAPDELRLAAIARLRPAAAPARPDWRLDRDALRDVLRDEATSAPIRIAALRHLLAWPAPGGPHGFAGREIQEDVERLLTSDGAIEMRRLLADLVLARGRFDGDASLRSAAAFAREVHLAPRGQAAITPR